MKNRWIMQVFIISFILSALFSGLSIYISDFNIVLLILIIFIVISIGIFFDMIGVATLTAKEAPFHARSSKKIREATACINLIKNNTKVSSICNDIIGDICGIVSGALGATFALYLTAKTPISPIISSILVAAFISSLTVGGKSFFKNIAIKKSDEIVLFVGKIISLFRR